MAYKAVKMNSGSSQRRYIFSQKELSGGLSFDDGEERCLSQLKNFIFKNGKLMTRGGFQTIFSQMEGPFHSIFEKDFHGNVFFHSGEKIYRFDGKELFVIKEKAQNCKSVFLTMNGNIYLYTKNGDIFEIKKDFSCEKAEPYIPEFSVSRGYDLSDYDIVEPVNMLTRKIKCTYYDMPMIKVIYTTPFDVDQDEDIEVYIDDKKYDYLFASCNEKNKLHINGQGEPSTFEKVSFVFSIAEDEKMQEYFSKIYGCDIAFCYGGTTNDGTRAFFTGNEDFPGMYLRSELKQPLYFPDTCEELLGDGSENVTAVQKRYEKLFFFTPHHIYSMKYSFSDQDGASFPITEINTNTGCSMKNTVRSIDNTPVFADTLTGIYLLQSTDIFDELNVKHISANLEGVRKDSFAYTGDGAVYASCDHDRKYYIYDGEDLYIWDYGKTPYYYSADSEESEKRLAWYKFGGVCDCVYIFSHKGKLYFICGKEKTEMLEYSEETSSDKLFLQGEQKDIPVDSFFMTASYDFGIRHSKKRLHYVSFEYEADDECCNMKAEFYANGKKFYEFTPVFRKKSGQAKIKLPPYYADRFAVKFEFCGKRAGIRSIDFCYSLAERAKYNL